jgi:hypothetical protein
VHNHAPFTPAQILFHFDGNTRSENENDCGAKRDRKSANVAQNAMKYWMTYIDRQHVSETSRTDLHESNLNTHAESEEKTRVFDRVEAV